MTKPIGIDEFSLRHPIAKALRAHPEPLRSLFVGMKSNRRFHTSILARSPASARSRVVELYAHCTAKTRRRPPAPAGVYGQGGSVLERQME